MNILKRDFITSRLVGLHTLRRMVVIRTNMIQKKYVRWLQASHKMDMFFLYSLFILFRIRLLSKKDNNIFV